MIEFATLSSIHNFSNNPVVDQHRLRYNSITKRQGWDVPCYGDLEFDQYDNPAAKYLVYRNDKGEAVGSSRLYPTTLPYMLENMFSGFVNKGKVPKSETTWEGSRFCIKNTLPAEERRKIAQYIVVGYLEAGLRFNIEGIVGLMYPAYWRHLFLQNGCEINFLGDIMTLDDGHKARAGCLPISEALLNRVREKTGIYKAVLTFGDKNEAKKAA